MKKTFTLFFAALLLSIAMSAEEQSTPSLELVSFKAVDDSISFVKEDVMVIVDFAANDSTGGGSIVFVDITVKPMYGKTGNPTNSTIQYTPSEDYYQYASSSPIDSFQYKISKNGSDTERDSAWVFIYTISGLNDVPLAHTDSFVIQQDSGAIYAQVLLNDEDKDRVGLTVDTISSPQNGTLIFSPTAFRYSGEYLFINGNGITPHNMDLELPFDQRTESWDDTVFVYTPNEGFYGYDSVKYVIGEYKAEYTPLPIYDTWYKFANEADKDTATIYFYVNPHDYIPVATNDTVYQLPGGVFMQESKQEGNVTIQVMGNDLDADTVPDLPAFQLEIVFFGAEKLASASQDTVLFVHNIPVYNPVSQSLVFKEDTNTAIFDRFSKEFVTYTYAPGFSGVDSLFYRILEKPLAPNSSYPAEYRGDTSDYGVVYFVVEPVNDVTIPVPDTLAFDLDQIEDPSENLWQYFDILANDVDIDIIDSATLSALERLMGDDFSSDIASYGSVHVKSKSERYGEGVDAINYTETKHNFTLEKGDSVYYLFTPPYAQTTLIDSIGYYIYNGAALPDTLGWAYITNIPPLANDDVLQISDQFIISEEDSTIANNFDLISNDRDADNDTLIIQFIGDDLKSPSQSPYAKIKDASQGNVNYFYHQGFTLKDSFQYIVSDLLTYDTAWVYINNTSINVVHDTLILENNPFANQTPEVEMIDVLINDSDKENIKNIIPFANGTDTLEGRSATITIEERDAYQKLRYAFRDTFFYKDSFQYVVTDVPAFFAAVNFFSQDSSWVYIIDTAYLADSDGDGIVNTMEDNIEGYQVGEDTIGIGLNGVPNYLNWDADNDGFPDGGDCDNDGIPNIFDEDECDGNSLDVSTAFTPNGDGVNDLFVIPDIVLNNGDVLPATIKIYNRWGSLVYENQNYGKNNDWWDGTLGDVQGLSMGKELPNGVYLYYLTYNGYEKEGFIHIQK